MDFEIKKIENHPGFLDENYPYREELMADRQRLYEKRYPEPEGAENYREADKSLHRSITLDLDEEGVNQFEELIRNADQNREDYLASLEMNRAFQDLVHHFGDTNETIRKIQQARRLVKQFIRSEADMDALDEVGNDPDLIDALSRVATLWIKEEGEKQDEY